MCPFIVQATYFYSSYTYQNGAVLVKKNGQLQKILSIEAPFLTVSHSQKLWLPLVLASIFGTLHHIIHSPYG